MVTALNSATVLTGPRILAVDDDPLTRHLMDIVFSTYIPNGSVTVAHGAERAIELMASSEFDVLVTDIDMPGLSGFELIDRVREENPKFPIVIHSGNGKDRMRTVARDVQIVEKGRAGIKSLVEAVLAAI